MSEKQYKVYVIQGRSERDYTDCQTALARVPAHLEPLSFIGDAAEVIERTHDADALIVSASPITREVMSALKNLKVVVRTGVGYDVIDVPAATDLGVVVVNIPDLWIREVANHALALLLAWNRKLIALNHEVKSGIWQTRVPGPVTGSLHGETVGIVGLGNIGSAFAKRAAALETRVIACDPYVADAHFAALGVERVSLDALAARPASSTRPVVRWSTNRPWCVPSRKNGSLAPPWMCEKLNPRRLTVLWRVWTTSFSRRMRRTFPPRPWPACPSAVAKRWRGR